MNLLGFVERLIDFYERFAKRMPLYLKVVHEVVAWFDIQISVKIVKIRGVENELRITWNDKKL